MRKLFSVACCVLFFALTGCVSTGKDIALNADATAASGWGVGEKVAEGTNDCFLVEGWGTCAMYRQFLGVTQDGGYLVQDFYEQDNVKMTNPYILLQKEEVTTPDFAAFELHIDGLYTKWHSNGHKWYEGVYKDGRMSGVWTLRHGNGQKAGQGNMEGPNEQGQWKYWHENGRRSAQGEFVNGNQVGLWRQWYDNGQKKSEATFVDGKLDGLWTEWYESGVKQAEGLFEMGKPVGVWREWDMAGELLREENRD